MTDLADLERRVAELERLVGAKGDEPNGVAASPDAQKPSAAADRATCLIQLGVTNKRYQPTNYDAGVYQEAMWFDCSLTLQPGARPTRAVKGALEFCDVFGEPRFVIGYTVNDTLQPGRSHHVSGVGFDFNEFMPAHQWMLATDVDDMVVRFRVDQVMYTDGTSERLD